MKLFLIGLVWYLVISCVFYLYKKFIKPKVAEKDEE